MRVRGGCHCGAVRFVTEISATPELLDCNCSICSKTGYLHLIVAKEAFELLRGEESLSRYRFGTGQAQHLFCKTCGIKSFYQPRSHPDCWSINYRCLDDTPGLEPRIVSFDGKDWEKARRDLDG